MKRHSRTMTSPAGLSAGLERKDASGGDNKQFDPTEIKTAIGELNTGFEEFKRTNDAAMQEMQKKGTIDPILEAKLDAINDDLDKHQKKLEEHMLSMKRQNRVVTDAEGNEIDLDQKAADFAAHDLNGRVRDFKADDLEGYEKVYNDFLRKGEELMGPDERKALSVGSDPDGGYTVHPDMSGRVVTKVYESSPMRAYASVQAIATDALEGVFDLDEAASGWVGETQARSETGTPQLKVWRIPVHELYAKPKATQKVLDDSSINIEAWLANKVSEKFARDEATAFVSGTGVAQPRGFLTYPSGTTNPGQIEQIKTGVNGGFAAAPAGGDVLINALYALKAPYRANATWFLNRSTTKTVRKLKDSDGAYLWMPGIAAGQPATILGYPMASFEDMPDIATGSLSMAVGDMRETYQIVDRIGIRVLRDPYSSKPYVEFYTTKRVGGDVINFESMKLIDFSA